MTEKFYPKEENIGENCMFWQMGCEYPKEEIIGRTSCEGMIDDVCLFLVKGRIPKSLSKEQIERLKLNPPSLTHGFLIPPGGIEL